MSNIYYDPEKYGLEVIAVLTDPNASWSFDDVVAWRDTETSKVYWAGDSGCSCPSPFEDYDRSNITPLTRENWPALEEATSLRRGYGWNDDEEEPLFYDAAEASEFLRKVGQAL